MTAVAATSVDPLAPATLGANATTLLQRDRWSREQLVDYQRERLRGLIRHAVEHSPYYRAALGPGAERAELADLPTLPKRVLMEQFDRIVTDRRLRLAGPRAVPRARRRRRALSRRVPDLLDRGNDRRARRCSSTRSRTSPTGSRSASGRSRGSG